MWVVARGVLLSPPPAAAVPSRPVWERVHPLLVLMSAMSAAATWV